MAMSWQTAAAALVGAAFATTLILATQPLNLYTTTANGVATQTLARPKQLTSSIAVKDVKLMAAPFQATGATVAENVASTSLKAPLMLIASGFMLLAAAAIRVLRPAPTDQGMPYTMLLTSGARAEREKRQKEKELARQREIQERLARLSGLGLLPSDHPVSTPVAAGAGAVAKASVGTQRLGEDARQIARQREVQERLMRLAKNGFSVPSSVGTVTKAPPANLTMHVYDHCPYCIRVELFLGWNGVKYNRVVYGYGDMEGPKKYIGKKQLPILTGDGAPYPAGMSGMPESLDMINWLTKEFGLKVNPASGRKDYSDWQKKAKNTIAGLMRPRLLKTPFRDFQTKQDVDYATAKWAKKGYSVEQSLANTPQLLVEMERLLLELEPLIKGDGSLNAGGWSMDDIFLLPDLRRLTVVKGLKWPPKVRNYVDKALNYPAMQCVPYDKWAF